MPALKVKKLHPDATVPTVAHPGKDLGFDLYSLEAAVLYPFITRRIPTGVACEMEGYGFEIVDRSSMALKSIWVSGGKIDVGYCGEMFVNLVNVGSQPYYVMPGDRVAQFMPRRPETDGPIVEVSELSQTSRGEAGYGSTGR